MYNYFVLCTVSEEIKTCIEQGGVMKEQCTAVETEVAGGCSSPHFCCCSPKDGEHYLNVILLQHSSLS